MTSKLLKTSAPAQIDDRLFAGIWLRWSALNTAERFVCANLVLIPLWWASGLLDYMPLFMTVGIFLYEWRRYGRIRLKQPSLVVIALFAFYAYEFVDTFLIYLNAHPSLDFTPEKITLNYLVKAAFEFSLPSLVWYIQSNNVRVRLEVVAWACSVVVVEMIVFWAVVQFAFPEAFVKPPRSLYGLLTGKSPVYADGQGTTNYLLFYDENRRFSFFFSNKQPCVSFIGFVGLLALDIKNRFWSLLLLAACIFLMILPEARSMWLAFPAVLLVRFILVSGKIGGSWLVFALIATASFITLSLPPVTNYISNIGQDTATAVSDYRPGSTEVRADIYQETLKRIPDKPLFGHKVHGMQGAAASMDGGGAGASKIGSHSVILGRLLYQDGLIGTGIFATFWVSLIAWFYETRTSRPICCFLTLILFTLTSGVSFLHIMYKMVTLLCMVIRIPKPAIKSFYRNAF